MALDALPGAAGGDAHDLVVVAGGPAGGEGVVQPEAVFPRQAVGDVREGGRALVCGNHQVVVVLVMAHHPGRRLDGVANQVVSDVQQAADEDLVAGDAARLAGLARLLGGRLLGGRVLEHEAALGADRHDHRVLDHLRLHQAQHLGTEVLVAVGPAQPAAGDRTAAQVHALDLGGVDEGLEHRHRARQFRHPVRVQLDADIGLGPAVGVALEIVAAQGRRDDAVEGAQHAVGVEAGHGVERGENVVLRNPLSGAVGIEALLEQGHQVGHQFGVGGQLRLHVDRRKRQLGLQQIARHRAHQHDLARRQTGGDHQPVEAVVLGAAGDDVGECLGDVVRALAGGRAFGLRMLGLVFVDPLAVVPGASHGIRPLGVHGQAEVLEDRQHPRQRHLRAAAVELERHVAVPREPHETQHRRRLGVEPGQQRASATAASASKRSR